MNLKKIITSFILIIVILWDITIFAKESDLTKCIEKKDYELYKCQVSNICLKQEYWKNAKKVVALDKFYEKDISYDKIKDWTIIPKLLEESLWNIEKAKILYRENQNKIYKCAIINSQISEFENIKEILNSTDKTGILKEIIKKLDAKKKKLEKIAKNKCIITTESSNRKKQIKKIVLDQSTLELCNYRYYLEYLDNRTEENIKDSFPKGKNYVSYKYITELISKKKSEIKKEIDHSFKLYPLAFESYIQYDSFLKIHILLELLKADYRVFRNKLYLALRPINQLVYKIINAQSK